jgi:hypothetical protein
VHTHRQDPTQLYLHSRLPTTDSLPMLVLRRDKTIIPMISHRAALHPTFTQHIHPTSPLSPIRLNLLLNTHNGHRHVLSKLNIYILAHILRFTLLPLDVVTQQTLSLLRVFLAADRLFSSPHLPLSICLSVDICLFVS